MYLRFLDDLETRYEITGEISQLSSNKVCIYQSNIPENTSGFEIVEGDETVISYDDYTVIYRKTDDHIVFTSDTKIHYVYYIYGEDGYVSGYMLTTREVNKPNTVFVRSGRGNVYENVPEEEYRDENGVCKYKVVNGVLTDITDEERTVLVAEKLEKVRSEKIAVLSSICHNSINEGIEYNGNRFSYKDEDKNELKEACEKAVATGMEMPYHANDRSCALYGQEALFEIYRLQMSNYVHHKTYFNQMKMYIFTLTTVEEIEAVYYGQELIGKYLDTYNAMIEQTQRVTEAYLSGLTPQA